MPDIRQIAADETHPLRRAVLRDGHADAVVQFPEDDDPATFHLGAQRDGQVVAVATFSPAETRFRSGVRAWQLRGMAVDPAHQGQGLGALVVAAAVDRIRAEGAHVLWCNARDTALGFYDGLGFIVHGEGFVTEATGLPHHVMILDL
ncbi:MAG TPA: GNAT family N-acetyltransferase [Acidimicrobiales bacterium]|nr:GNAT family N-acetyltransferase [Acidimicrobiales bacterium]